MIKIIIKITFLCSFIISSSYSIAATDNVSQFLSRLSPDEGLSQSYVTKTVQDNQGFIWIATEMGLNRYDGYQVSHISGPNDIFDAESISTLFIDRQGYLWVSTTYSGLYRINTATLETRKFFSGKLDVDDDFLSEVITIEQGANNTLWLGISGHVYLLDIDSGQLTKYLSLIGQDNIVRDLLLEQQWLYCATSQGLFRINIQTRHHELINHLPKSIDSQDSLNVKFLINDPFLGLLIGTVEGLFQLNQSGVSGSKQLIADLNIWDMVLLGNQYMVATDKGVYLFDPQTLKLNLLTKFSNSSYRITDDNVIDLYKDNSGIIWLASKSQGVLRWSPQTRRFKHISASTQAKLSHDNVMTLLTDGNDTLWVGTNNGLNKVDLERNTVVHYLTNDDKKSVTGKQVISGLFEYTGDSNKLWLVNDDGLAIFNKTTGKLSQPFYTSAAKKHLTEPWLGGHYVLDNEHIVFITLKSHYLYNSISGEITPLAGLNDVANPELSFNFIGSFPQQKNTVLLVSSGHLYSYDLIKKHTTLLYQVKNYQPQTYDSVDNWVIDHNNILWLAVSGEGLIGLDYQTLQEKYRYDTTNKLSTNNIYSLQLDQFSSLWFSSQKGLSRLNLDSHHIETFEVDDGLIANEFNGSAYTVLSDQRLVYGSTRGITIVAPDEFVTRNQPEPDYRVSLTALSLMSDRARQYSDLTNLVAVTLAHDDYGLALKFSTLQYYKQQKTNYNIELIGPESINYHDVTNNEMLLPKLSPGDYQLIISAIDPVTGNLSVPLVLEIHALYPPWSSPLAKFILATLLLICCGLYIYRHKQQQRSLLLAHNKSQASKAQMKLALQSSNSGIWDYYIADDLLYEDRVMSELGYQKFELPISSKLHISLIHPDDHSTLKPQWRDFFGGKTDGIDVSYRMRSKTGEWHWYRDVGRVISRDQFEQPTRVSGTYTNITATKANEMRAQLFGEAFSQINDWVLILDAKREPVTANAAFLKAFSFGASKKIPQFDDFVNALGEQKYQEFKEIIDNIAPGKSWHGEEVIVSAEKEYHPVLVSINAIANRSETISNYVIVVSDITNQKDAEEKLRHLAHYDFLTNLPNRKLILERIECAITKFEDNKKKFALFFIDLDKFKQINDSLGHSVGDDLLRHVADTIVSNIKVRDLVARQSGDEFMILIEGFESIDDLSHLAQRLNKCLAQPINLQGSLVNITSSIGIAIYPDDAASSADLIRTADLAMIHAKDAGRSQFQFFTQDMNEKVQQRLLLEGELRQAFIDNALVNFYQPIVHSGLQKVIGFELLLRWPRVDGMIPPGVFIPIAEDIGLISKITEVAVDQALADYAKLQRQGSNIYISVNLSPIHILQQGLCQTLTNLLAKHKLPPEVLRLEITEGILFTDQVKALARLKELKSHGFKLLLDDFGTGYSSLTYLSQFPIDVLKIDQSFVRNFDTNPMNKPIIKSIVSLADNLGLSCIAEGVETYEQLSYIRSLGCENIQGYFYAKPVSVNEIANLKLDEKFDVEFNPIP